MQVTDIPLEHLVEAPWNPNQMDEAMRDRLHRSLDRYGLVQNLVVRPLVDGCYEVLSGNQRLQALKESGYQALVPCVVVDLGDAQAMLLSQALNRVQGEDDLGLRSEILSEVLAQVPEAEVLKLLPETAQGLQALASLGQQDMAGYLQGWQQAQAARLRHLTFQSTPAQLEVIEEALALVTPKAREAQGDNPNVRGTGLFLLCRSYLELTGRES